MGIIEAEGTLTPVKNRPASTAYNLRVKLLDENAILPTRGSEEAAGLDLYALEDVNVPGWGLDATPTVVSTGVAVAIPQGCVGLVYVRSSLGFKHNITLANSVGVIDSDYRGEIKVALQNNSNEDFIVEKGHRFAQLVITPVIMADAFAVDELPETERGEGGMGSTGR